MLTIRKRQLLGLLILACLLMVLIAVSLPVLQMQPGELFPFQADGGGTSGINQLPEDIGWGLVLVQGMIAILILLLPVYIIIGLLNKEERKKMLANIAIIALLLLVLMWPHNQSPNFNQADDPSLLQPTVNNLPEVEFDPTISPAFNINLQPWMLPLIMIVAAVLLAAVAFVSLKFLSGNNSLERSPYLDIAENAQNALNEIEEAIEGFDDVIIRCYVEMSRTLQTEKDIQRDEAMTTSEFERELLAKGFPARPIQKLTQLFEQVRYGRQQSMEKEKLAAVDSLNEIIDYCRGKA